jgi:hypothetical protein
VAVGRMGSAILETDRAGNFKVLIEHRKVRHGSQIQSLLQMSNISSTRRNRGPRMSQFSRTFDGSSAPLFLRLCRRQIRVCLSMARSERAIILYGSSQDNIQFRSISTGQTRDLVVKEWSGLIGINWSADGSTLLVSWRNFERDSVLLNVSLDGGASVLLKSHNPEIHAVP